MRTMKTKDYIKSIRKKYGLTQEEFSKLLGIKRYNLAKYETGASEPPGNILLRVVNCDTRAQKRQAKSA